jgi:predicted ester cyclase
MMKKFFMILPLALISCFMVGCQDKKAMTELEAIKAQLEVEEQNKEIVRRLAEEEDGGNLFEIIDEIVAPNVIYHYPNNDELSGLENLKQNRAQLHTAFSDIKHTIKYQVAEDDLVVTHYTWSGTHNKEWLGIEPTDQKIALTILETCRLKDGKIVEAWVEFEFLGFMQQLGMELNPKEME